MNAIREITRVKPNGLIEIHNPALSEGENVEVIILLEPKPSTAPALERPSAGRKLKLDWGGALAGLASQYTSVELQHKANEWRGD